MKTVKFLFVTVLLMISLATVGFSQQGGHRGGHGGRHGGHGGHRYGGGGWHGYGHNYPSNQFYFNLGIPFFGVPYYYGYYGYYQPYYPPYQYYPPQYPPYYGAYPYMNFGFQLYGR